MPIAGSTKIARAHRCWKKRRDCISIRRWMIPSPQSAARSLRAKALGVRSVFGGSEDALQAAQRAFVLVRDHAGTSPHAMAEAHATLAQVMGGGRDALDAAQAALRLREDNRAPIADVAQSLLVLCHVATNMGDFSQALLHCQRAQALYAESGATRSEAYRVTLSYLGVALSYQGEHERAILVARERLSLTGELFGEDSIKLAMGRVAFAESLAEHGRFDEAESLLEAAVGVVSRRGGIRSTQYANTVFQFGRLHFLRGEFVPALAKLREALAIQEAVIEGHDDNRLHVMRTALAQVLVESGSAGEEPRVLLDSVILERSALDDTVREGALAYARLPLAQWHVLRGEYVAALALLDQVEAVGSGVEAELHARVAATRSLILAANGDADGARDMVQAAYEITRKERGAENPRTARHAMEYARMLRRTVEIGAADALERRYRPVLEAAYPLASAYRAKPGGAFR